MPITKPEGVFEIDTNKPELDTLTGFVGLGCVIGVVLSLYVIIPGLIVTDGIDMLWLRLVYAVSMVIGFFIVRFGAYVIARHKCAVLLAGSAIGLGAMIAVFFVPIGSLSILILSHSLMVVCLSFLLVLWFAYVCSRQSRMTPVLVAISAMAGLSACLLECYLTDLATKVLSIVMWAVSFGSMLALIRIFSSAILPSAIRNRESSKRSKIPRTSKIMLSIIYFQFGLIVSIAADVGVTEICLGAATVIAALVAFDCLNKKIINERNMLPITPSVTVFSLVALFLFDDIIQAVALCALAVLFVIYAVSGWTAIAEHARISKLSSLYTFSYARSYDYLAMALGFVFGFEVVSLAQTDAHLAVQMLAIISLVYSFLAAFCHKARFPETGIEGVSQSSLPEMKGLWKKRCSVVSDLHGLSERQHEVLLLIVQGRNAKYVGQILTISVSTAQTHIRNIYRKTGVHSRQELLDLIEATKLYGED